MKKSTKKVPFKKWDRFDKSIFAWALGFMAFSAAMTALHIKEKDTKYAIFQGVCTTFNAVCVKKIMNDARKHVKERE